MRERMNHRVLRGLPAKALVTALFLAVGILSPWTTDAADVPRTPAEGAPMDLLFIHHSCGGALLAAPGPVVGGGRDSGERCIYVSHPNGGGLRDRLEAAGFQVNQASYGSIVGEDTDICHWRAKFATQMDRILRTQRQDELLPEGRTNRIVCFKSCYPNNGFTGDGGEPGDPDDCERTVANAKAAYRSLLPLLRTQPDVLFVAFTAPPLADPPPSGLKQRIKHLLRPVDRGGRHARAFNAWLADREGGWLAGYELPNVVVFDFYHLLTREGATDYAAFATWDGQDSHPSQEGNALVTDGFVPFLARAVAGMGWTAP